MLNVKGNEEKEQDRDDKETGTVEKTSRKEKRVSEDEMERVQTTALFHQFHGYFIFLEGGQKREVQKPHH